TSVSLVALAGVSVVIFGVLGGVVRSAGDGRRIPLAVVLGFASGVLIGLGALYSKALFVSLGQGATVVAWAVFLPLTLVANIGGLWGNQAGFPHGRALIVVAMNAVTNKIVSIVGGMVTLGELLPADASLATARVVGFATIIGGTVMLARFGAPAATAEVAVEVEVEVE